MTAVIDFYGAPLQSVVSKSQRELFSDFTVPLSSIKPFSNFQLIVLVLWPTTLLITFTFIPPINLNLFRCSRQLRKTHSTPTWDCHCSRGVWCQGSPLVPVKSQHSSALKELKHAQHTNTHRHARTRAHTHTLTPTKACD